VDATGPVVRILVVDDEPAHREAILRSLESARAGYRVRTAGSLREYRECVAEELPDLAILDLVLPDGRAETALADPPESAAFAQVVMTSHGDEQVAVAALKAGALDYVVKSSEAFSEMPMMVERALRSWRLLTGRRLAERLQSLSAEVLSVLNESAPLKETVDRILDAIRRGSGMDAVGIRLRDGSRYPFVGSIGISEEFLAVEGARVFSGDPAKGVSQAAGGSICERVLTGRGEPGNPQFTAAGSFWTSRVNDLLGWPGHAEEGEEAGGGAGTCLYREYPSTALIPIRTGGAVVGLLQLNARQPGRLGLDLVGYFEGIVASFGVALQRRQTLEALRVSEQRFRDIVYTSADWVWEVDGEYRYTYVSESVTGLLGYEPWEILGRRPFDLMPPGEAERVRELVLGFAAVKRPFSGVENVNIHRDGSLRHLLTSGVPVLDAAGRLAGFRGMDQDITARKQVEAALRESETRFLQVTEHVGEWVWEVDAEGLFVYSSSVAERLIGYAPGDLVGRVRFFDLVAAEERERLKREAFGRPELRESVLRFPNRCQHREGHMVLLETSGTPLVDKRGRLIGYRGASRDITAREQSEKQLRSQARLLDLAQDAIAVQDMQGRVRFWNESSHRLTGWTSVEAMERRIDELLVSPGTDWELVERELVRNGAWTGELQILRKDGRGVSVMSRWTLVRDDRGEPESVLLITTDVTERKKLEAQFLRAQRLESVGALASGIAHDLNNILSPILMSAPLLRETGGDSEIRAMLDTIELCAQRGADITRQLLTFARGTPGARVPIPVRHLLREMDQILRETFPRDIRSSVAIPAELWAVQGDATQLHQALMNLCLNSRDAMTDGGQLKVRARNVEVDAAWAGVSPGAQPGPHVCLSVADTGTGIPPELLDRIFDPFFTTKEVGKGTGLGLASVLGIVRGHGGFIRVTSEVGQGTTFELYFPASPQAPQRVAQGAEGQLPRGRGELILVIEDETSILRTLQRTLELRGYRVLTAAQGAEGLGVFRECRREIRAVITDMMMPVMNGPAIVKALRQIDPGMPILGMTGLPERSALKGFDGLELPCLLTKPFTSEELVRALQNLLETASGGAIG
jgi:PAS domain S-box-containing protein